MSAAKLVFKVYNDGKLAKDFQLSSAYLFGTDSTPLRNSVKIKCKGGVIECTKKSPENAGLSLLWDVKDYGRVLLSTTRLPARSEPYILNVELARAKLMQAMLKREDWSLFELDNEIERTAQESQEFFIKSLQNIREPEKASVFADKALEKAVEFSEAFAERNAEMIFDLRCKNKALGRHSLGCVIKPSMLENERYAKRFFEMFRYVTVPVNWAEIEREKDQYDFSGLDKSFKHLSKHRAAICAGPLLSFVGDRMPKWITSGKITFDQLRKAAFDFVTAVVKRYEGHVHAWRVISGLNALNCFGFNFEQMIEMTRAVCLAAKNADDKSRKIIDVVFPWGEYYALKNQTIPPFIYVDMLLQNGISFDALGLVMMFGKNRIGMQLRDIMQISSKLDSFSIFGKPVHITGVSVPDKVVKGSQDPEVAGYWRKAWDEQVQSDWIEKFYKIALGKLFVSSVTYSSFADSDDCEIAGGGLLNEQLEPKKAYLAIGRLRKKKLHK